MDRPYFYVFLKNQGKNNRVPTFFYVFSKIYVVKNTSIFEKKNLKIFENT